MRFYLLSDSPDIRLGMRLAGIDGEIVNTAEALHSALMRLAEDKSIGIVAINTGLALLAPELITQWKLKKQQPLLVEIPDRSDPGELSRIISGYIAETIGIKV